MKAAQTSARITGVLFLITFVTSIAALVLFQPVLDDPFAPEMVKLGAEHAEADGVDGVDPLFSGPSVAEQPGILQHFQVLRDRRPADREPARQLADRARALSEALATCCDSVWPRAPMRATPGQGWLAAVWNSRRTATADPRLPAPR